MRYLTNISLFVYGEIRLLGYDLSNLCNEAKEAFVSKDEKKATEILGKVVGWIIATGVVFIAYGTIKGLMTQ